MKNREPKYDHLDQYDFADGEWLEKVADKYFSSIGEFVISFSQMEYELNVAIADIISHGSHDIGYTVIEGLQMNPKIELFSRLYRFFASAMGGATLKAKCKELTDRLKAVNKFRNELVHGSWPTLNKEYYLRTKIESDSDSGYIKFKNMRITRADIRQAIREVDKLSDELLEFGEASEAELVA